MANFDLTTVSAALAQGMAPRVQRTFNSLSVAMRLFRKVPGAGKNLAWDVEYTGAIGENFSDGADVSNYGIDTPQFASLSWGLYRSNFQITNQAAAAAASSFQPQDLINPFARQMDNSARKLASTLNGVVYSGAGTGTTIAGLALAIKDDNTYAGIDRSSGTHAQFRAKVIDPGTLTDPTIALIRSDLGSIYDQCGESPDIALCNTAVWNKVAGLFTDVTRYNKDAFVNAEGRTITMDASIDAMMIDKCMFIKDKDATANVIYYLNSNYVEWEYLPPVNLAPDANQSTVMQLQDQDGELGLALSVYPLARTGAAAKMTMEVMTQLKVTRPNACGKRLNVNA